MVKTKSYKTTNPQQECHSFSEISREKQESEEPKNE